VPVVTCTEPNWGESLLRPKVRAQVRTLRLASTSMESGPGPDSVVRPTWAAVDGALHGEGECSARGTARQVI
jgi:hypothetical protein